MDTPTKFAEEIASEFDDDSEFRKSKGYFCTPKQGATLLVKGGGLDLSKTADLGAGVGMLTAALVESVASGTKNRHIHCTLYPNPSVSEIFAP